MTQTSLLLNLVLQIPKPRPFTRHHLFLTPGLPVTKTKTPRASQRVTRDPGTGQRLCLPLHPLCHPHRHHGCVPVGSVIAWVWVRLAMRMAPRLTSDPPSVGPGPPADPSFLLPHSQLTFHPFAPHLSYLQPVFQAPTTVTALKRSAMQNTNSSPCPCLVLPLPPASLKAACGLFSIKLIAETGEPALGLCALKTNTKCKCP